MILVVKVWQTMWQDMRDRAGDRLQGANDGEPGASRP